MKFIFDVGANDGSSSIHYLRDPEAVIFAFEPNRELIETIKRAIPEHYVDWGVSTGISGKRYNIIPAAVSDYVGIAKFNVCTTADRGCSSLLELSEKGKTEWGGRRDMFPEHQIEVAVLRLDHFIEDYNINQIQYFHCDTQGSDLKVLQGMGHHIYKICEGVVEAGNKPDILYNGQNTTEETVNFLISKGFEITGITSNDVQNNEVNVNFKRKYL